MSQVMIDIDDVVFPTMWSIHQRALAAGLHDGTAKMLWTGWEAYTLPGGAPCTPEVYWDLWSDFALDGGYTSTPPIDEAAAAVRRLHLAGHEIHLVTARAAGLHDNDSLIARWTEVWLDDFAIPYETLTFTRDKVGAMIDLRVSFDYAIDDRAKNVSGLRDAGVEAYLLTHEHNAADQGLPRVATVTQFADIIEEST